MAVSHTTNLARRGQVFYFRRAIPSYLRRLFGCREIKLSLKTRDLATAKIRCRTLSNQFEKLLARVASMPDLTMKEVRELAREYFEQEWSRVREFVYCGSMDNMFDRNAELEGAIETTNRLRENLSHLKFDKATKISSDEILAAHGYSEKSVSSEMRHELYVAVLRARTDVTRILAALLQGHYQDAEPHDPLFKGIEQPDLPPTPGGQDAPAKHTLAALADKYCAQKKASEWVSKTFNENRRVLNWFAEYVGGTKPIKAITLDDVRDFRDAIRDLPANFAKNKKFSELPLKQTIESGKGLPKLAPKTSQKYYFNLKGFLNWCVNEGYLDKNPAGNLKLNIKINEAEARYPFSKDQLNKLFKSPQYTGHRSETVRSKPGELVVRDGKYWIPLVGLFTGMRLGEIVQLRIADIKEKDGVRYFDIALGEDEGKHLKTKSSQRSIPIHHELVALGFHQFVKGRQKTSPKGRLFEDIKPGKDGYFSHNFSKYFSRYLRQAGVKTTKTVFHSFRHNFTDALRDAGIEDSHMKALLGHADQSVTAQYGSKFSPRILAKDMKKVTFGLNLGHLKKYGN